MPINPRDTRQALASALGRRRDALRAGWARLAERLKVQQLAEYLGLLHAAPATEPLVRDAAAPMRSQSRMLDGPVVGSLLGMALPIMGTNMLQVANQFIDTFWVGRLGAVGLAAVTVASPIIILLLSCGLGFGAAGAALVAQYTGARRRDMVDEIAGQTLIAVLAFSVVLGVAGALGAPFLLDIMGVAPDVRAGALAFLHIGFLGLPLSFAYFMFGGLMRGVGRATIPLKITAGMVTLNTLLNPFLIFGVGPIPALGVAGSALSTFIAQLCAVIVGVVVLSRGQHGISVRWSKLRPNFDQIKRTVILGYPSALDGGMRGLSLVVMTFLVTGLGTVATAAYGVGSIILNIVLVPAMGFSLATATLVGQNIGAGQIERAALVGRASGAISFTALCILGVLGFIFAEPVARLFVPNDAYVMHEAALFIRIMSVSFGFIGLQNACAGVLRGAGLMTKTMLITVIAQWIVQFPLAYALAERTPLGSHGIYWAISIANFVACGLAFVMFARGDWKNVRLIETTPD